MKPEKLTALNQVFEKMPNQFTSYEFVKRAKKMGFRVSSPSGFLHSVALNGGSMGKLWTKKPVLGPAAGPGLTVEVCIAFLKERGYKIMKPVSEWQEV